MDNFPYFSANKETEEINAENGKGQDGIYPSWMKQFEERKSYGQLAWSLSTKTARTPSTKSFLTDDLKAMRYSNFITPTS